ncbi:unnamed protein product [Echinostoma caproni]|uniref:Uncharacterized protein n=1 Tax=Echinostoma caproni TaxID=27848 RepID=A0A183AB73_9TREM|nr:unnamed protein product [Echinostoma caproni]
MEGGKKRAPANKRMKNGTHPTRCADVVAGSTSRDNVDYHPQRTNRQVQLDRGSAATQNDSTGCHYVRAVDQRISRYDLLKPAGTARVRAKCGPKPAGIDQQKEA